MEQSGQMTAAENREDFRKVGLTTCAALVVANMIGTGVFTSLGFQVEALPSPFLILAVWTLGGVVALCGALCYAELAAMFPRSGGEYNFLARTYHPAVGLMGGFVSIAVGFSAPIALSSLAFGNYLAAAVPGIPPTGAAIAAVVVLAAVHSATVRASGGFQVVVTSLKVLLILVFIGLGLRFGHPPDFSPGKDDVTKLFSGPFAIALMFVLYSYSGWNAAVYIMSEVRRPQWTVPRALLWATGSVTLLYVAINAVFLSSGPAGEFAGKIPVGEIAAKNLIGEAGGRVMSGLIAAGLVSAISAMTWAGPRVSQTIGSDFSALRFLAATSVGGVPRLALLLQTLLVLLMLATSSFQSVLLYAQVALLACNFLVVLGVIVLRWRRPDLDRPFRCIGYPLTPVVFLAVNVLAIGYTVREAPVAAGAGLLTLLVGLALYLPARKLDRCA